MQTVIIWDSCGEDAVKFFVVEGDKRDLDGTFISSVIDEKRTEEKMYALLGLVMDEGETRKMETDFNSEKFRKPVREGAPIIVCGFIP
jgi:hypothetical protein